ncbi:MAG TPA: serine/threonine-protein kinase [Vicinamibacteria bacterium]|nr:serine/threonine-protein kinase [Vicinamibacteria bacterium]
MNVRTLGRYEIRGVIGRGSMGVVYHAHDPVIDRPVALKTVVIPDSIAESRREVFLKRFFQEARAAGKLLHPNIVVTYDAATDESNGIPFIAMEFIEGESLSQHLKRKNREDWKKVVAWGVALARALHHAHQERIVHRDIKPGNVLITRRGVPKIADFGIAKLPAANLTGTGIVVGTPYFMSPEQLRGKELDGRSDLFSLGALLYNLVAGQRPFEGKELAAIASQVLLENPRPLSEIVSDVPPALDGVLARALAKSPGDRYASGEELAQDLLAVKQENPSRETLAPAERARASAVLPPQPSAVPPAPERRNATSPTVRSQRAFAPFGAGLGRFRRFRTRFVVAGILACLLAMALFYRDEIAQRKLFFDARTAVKNGELVLGEQRLEELLERNPQFDEASSLLLAVSGKLVLPALPLELTVKHDHSLGSCTGKLTLHESSIEYWSRKHGLLQWRFEYLQSISRRGSRGITVQTYEDDVLGLVSDKNYNFSVLGDPPDDALWKRYERLFQNGQRTERERSPAPQ